MLNLNRLIGLLARLTLPYHGHYHALKAELTMWLPMRRKLWYDVQGALLRELCYDPQQDGLTSEESRALQATLGQAYSHIITAMAVKKPALIQGSTRRALDIGREVLLKQGTEHLDAQLRAARKQQEADLKADFAAQGQTEIRLLGHRIDDLTAELAKTKTAHREYIEVAKEREALLTSQLDAQDAAVVEAQALNDILTHQLNALSGSIRALQGSAPEGMEPAPIPVRGARPRAELPEFRPSEKERERDELRRARERYGAPDSLYGYEHGHNPMWGGRK